MSISNPPLEEMLIFSSLERLANTENGKVPSNPPPSIKRVFRLVKLLKMKEGMLPMNPSPTRLKELSLFKLLRHEGMLIKNLSLDIWRCVKERMLHNHDE